MTITLERLSTVELLDFRLTRSELGELGALRIPLATLLTRYVHPVGFYKGRMVEVSSGFRTESRPGHDGVDLLLRLLASDGAVTKPNTDGQGKWWFPSGRSALSVADGIVKQSKVTSTGGYIMIEHAGGVYSQYMHLARRDVAPGTAVRKGQPIGVIGPGDSHLVHLHFQLIIDKTYVDPEPYLQYMPSIIDPRDRVAGGGGLGIGGALVAFVGIGTAVAGGIYLWSALKGRS